LYSIELLATILVTLLKKSLAPLLSLLELVKDLPVPLG
jgi:hypothetical protein